MRPLRNFLLILTIAVTGVVGEAADLSPALIQRCKKATVLVDLGSGGSGSGFLVHASGLFVTNAHVVRKVLPGSPVKLILSSGLPEQQILPARVVLVDEENDLALLKTDAAVTAEPLPLADDAGLEELARAIVFGYPFGTRLASGSESYPAISINEGRISSLRRDGAALERIQFDAVTNHGNSGGPLVGSEGKVMGIVNSGIEGANVNFAIPAAKLLSILQKPVLSLKTPQIPYAKRTEARKFEVEIFPTAPIPQDAAVTVRFGEAAAARKPLAAVRTDGRWSVTAAPAEPGRAPGPLRLRLEANFNELVLAANFDDGPVKVGNREVRLSELYKIEQKAGAAGQPTRTTTTLAHYDDVRQEYETVAGKVTGLPALHSKINDVTVKLEDASRITIGTYDPGTLGVPYEIVLSSKGKAVATAEGTLVFADPPQGLDFDDATDGRYSYGGIKILPLVEPEHDGKQGSWVRVEKGLETKDEASAWCELPVQPGNSYVLDVRVTPKQNGKGELLFWLPVGKTAALVRIDGDKGTMKLDLAEGKGRGKQEDVSMEPFTGDTKLFFRAMVWTSGPQARIIVWRERGMPIAWFGPIKNLAPHPEVPIGAGRPSIGHRGLAMTVESIRLDAEVSGLRVLREMPGQIRYVSGSAVGHWSFDESPSESKISSATKPGPFAYVRGTPQIGVGPAVLGTGAMRLDGNAGSGITVGETVTSTRGNHPHRTLSMWFRADSAVPGDQRQYLYAEGASDRGFALYLEGTTLFAGGWDTKESWPGTWLEAPELAAGRWHHVALVLDGERADKTKAFELYVDGAPAGAGFGQALPAHASISIGSVVNTTRASPESTANRALKNHQFTGLIDEVWIFNAALGQGSLALLAGGRFGIGAPNDLAVSAPAALPAARPGATPSGPVPDAASLHVKAIVPANSPDAYSIPGLRKGSRLSLAYTKGKWKSWGHIPSATPDDAEGEMIEYCRMVIALPSKGGRAGQVLAVVPAGTQQQPFVFRVEQDYPALVLRINDKDNTYETNPGGVEYDLEIIPPGK